MEIQFSDIVPGLTVIIGTENEGQTLAAAVFEYIHGGQQESVGMPNHRGRAQTMTGKAVALILRVQVINDGTDSLAGTGKTDTAFFAAGFNIEFVIQFRLQPGDIKEQFGSPANIYELALIPHTAIDAVAFCAVQCQLFQMDSGAGGDEPANVDVTNVKKEGLIGSIVPTVMFFHVKAPFFLSEV